MFLILYYNIKIVKGLESKMRFACVFMITVILSTVAVSELVNDVDLFYSVEIPETWKREKISETHHQFYDSTGSYSSVISIRRYDISTDDSFDNPEEWARASYLSYIINVQSTLTPDGVAMSDPFCVTIYYDSSDVKQNDSLWAGDVYAKFYSTDTTFGSWAEYVRYTNNDAYGYEIYAIGFSDDMDTAVGYYASIIDGFRLGSKSAITYNVVKRKGISTVGKNPFSSDLLGRICNQNGKRVKVIAPGVYIINRKQTELINIR